MAFNTGILIYRIQLNLIHKNATEKKLKLKL